MKKTVLSLIILFLCLPALLAYDNMQKIFPVDSEVYQAIKNLYVQQGLSLPSATGPWSAAELSLMLEKIDASALNSAQKSIYDFAVSELSPTLDYEGKGVGFDFTPELNLEIYAHKDTGEAFQGRENWIYGTMDQQPFLALDFETWAANNFYGWFEFDVMNSYKTHTPFGSTKLAANIPAFQNLSLYITDLNFNFPYRAFVSAGGDYWTVQLGRDRVSWGAGQTGNLIIGDNLMYHNMLRFTAFADRFKYTFLASVFPHPMNYDGDNWGQTPGQELINEGLYMFLGHRLEGRFFKDRLGFTLTESIMYASENGTIDLQIFNPAMFYHNLYYRYMSNSILGFEADWAVMPGLNVYGSLVIDEFWLFETDWKPGVNSQGFPSANGFILGVNGSFTAADGLLYGSAEFAKTSPFLYLRYGTNTSQNKGQYGINYVVAIRHFHAQDGASIEEEFLGYKYGGDAIVANLNVGYKVFGSFHVEGNIFFMAHGTFDKDTCWTIVGNGDGTYPDYNQLQTPTTWHPTDNHTDANANSRNSVSYTTVIGINGGYTINKNLSAMAQLDFINISNYGNISGQKASDVQLTVGLKLTN